MYAIGTHSLGMAWTLISTAARLCQSLGYHRLAVRKNTSSSDENAKMALFRYVYILDQTLSLRLGRPSSLRECDLATDSLPNMPTSGLQVSEFVSSLWIEAAQLHAWTFERLYSPKAMELSQNARTEAMKNLAFLTLAAKSRNSKVASHFNTCFDVFLLLWSLTFHSSKASSVNLGLVNINTLVLSSMQTM